MRAPSRINALDLQTPASPDSKVAAATLPPRVGIVGAGRLGNAMAAALRAAGVAVDGPARRGEVPDADVILLCVPDREIRGAAAAVAGAATLVGHCSGMTPLAELEPAVAAGAEAFALHPLQSFAPGDVGHAAERFRGAGCAIGGSTPRALALAHQLARTLGMRAFEIDDSQRPAYHAAASTASNFLVTIEWAAERVAAGAGLAPAEARALLAPLVRTTVENWAAHGPEEALTGPIARGDENTVARQRSAVAGAADDLLPLFDALVEATRALAGDEAAERLAARMVEAA